MDKAINYYELKQELADLGFTDPQITDDLRSAVFLESEEQRIATQAYGVAFDLDLLRDNRNRLSFISYAGSLGAGTDNWQLQTFQSNVHAGAAAELLEARAVHTISSEDLSFMPLDPKAVQKEIRTLYLHNMKINKETAETFAGFVEEAKSNGQQWITYEMENDEVKNDSWYAFSQVMAAIEDTEIIRPFANRANVNDLLPKLYQVIDPQAHQLEQAAQVHDLQKQLSDLGFHDPAIAGELRIMVTAHESLYNIDTRITDQFHFGLSYEKTGQGYRLYCIEAAMDVPDRSGQQVMQYFKPDVPVSTATEFVKLSLDTGSRHDPFTPLNHSESKQFIQELKSNTMNTENLNYLQKQLLNMGFGEQLNEELEKNIKTKSPEFTLQTTQEYNQQNVDYTLHYKAGEQNEMYFFNKYDAQAKDQQHTFYINRGNGITAKEAYNLLEGRAVHKQLENLENEKYNAWIIIDKDNKNENGQPRLRTFNDKWNFKPEKPIDMIDIVGINEPGAREKLMKSLEKGNRHQVSAMKNGKEVKLFIEANPAEHRVNLTNWKGEAQQLEHYKKPEFKQQKEKNEPAKTQKETKAEDGTKKKAHEGR